MSKFNQEKRVFDRLKSDCSEDAKYEYEYVLSILIERYNTTIYENRLVLNAPFMAVRQNQVILFSQITRNYQ